MTFLSGENLVVGYGAADILHGCSIDVNKGEIVSILGPNGAGKTTLLKILFGMISPTSGSIQRQFDNNKYELSYVFQNSVFLNRSVEDNLNHVLFCKNINKSKWKNLILNTLKEFNLDYMLSLNLKSLSGGELQLLALVRAVLIHPDILFYDEPTNNLDSQNIETFVKMINKFDSNGTSIIIVSHDDDLIKKLKHDELIMKEGVISK